MELDDIATANLKEGTKMSEYVTVKNLGRAEHLPYETRGFHLVNPPPRPEAQGLVPECIINGVLLFISENETGSYCPVNDLEGISRPYILAKHCTRIDELVASANQIHASYDCTREFDGYPPFEWDREEAVFSDGGRIRIGAVPGRADQEQDAAA